MHRTAVDRTVSAERLRRKVNTPFFLATLVVMSCGREQNARAPQDSAMGGADSVNGAPTSASRDTAGSGAINWTVADLQTRMRHAGINAIPAGQVRQSFLGAPGTRFTMQGGELQAFVYADAGALSHDIDVLDTVRVSPPGTMIDWRLPPKLIVSNNLAVILLTRDLELRKTITEAVRPNLFRHDQSARPADATDTGRK